MPVTFKKTKGGKVRVSTPNGVKAKATTMQRAKAQQRILNAVDHGWRPTKSKSMKKMTKKTVKKAVKASKPGDKLKAFAAKMAVKKSKK